MHNGAELKKSSSYLLLLLRQQALSGGKLPRSVLMLTNEISMLVLRAQSALDKDKSTLIVKSLAGGSAQ